MSVVKRLQQVQLLIQNCRACPNMCSTPVHGVALNTSIMLLGQAPGAHESTYGKPFAYTAGKTLFKWFEEGTGVDEETFRAHVYMAAVARCFPGKSGRGDRPPDTEEIERCREHLKKEVAILKPKLIIAVGRVAITEVLGVERFSKSKTLSDVVGKKLRSSFLGHEMDVICLPHPSGVSSWPHTVDGKKKLKKALSLLGSHPEWQEGIHEL